MKKKFYQKWWFWLIIALLVIGAVGNAMDETKSPARARSRSSSPRPEAVSEPAPTSAPTPAPTPTPSPTPAPTPSPTPAPTPAPTPSPSQAASGNGSGQAQAGRLHTGGGTAEHPVTARPRALLPAHPAGRRPGGSADAAVGADGGGSGSGVMVWITSTGSKVPLHPRLRQYQDLVAGHARLRHLRLRGLQALLVTPLAAGRRKW